ncbi:MAG: hypothetical protein HXY50_11835 [Ignavibacteriaceae bacterium]|nr:hypothetical protein [Ignavibacteriaceae bacterium]
MNGPDSTLSIWNAETEELLRVINGIDKNILNAASFNNDGSLIAFCNWSKLVKVYETKTGKLYKELIGSNGGSAKILFSPDGESVALISTENAIVLWNINTGNLFAKMQVESRPFSLKFSNSGKLIAAGEANGKITIWNSTTYEKNI